MDFDLEETPHEVASLAAQVLARADPAELGGGFDRARWKELGQAGLLSLCLPAALGGDGLGLPELAALLTETGRRAAPIPALATLMLGAWPVTRWGGEAAQRDLLAGVAAGDTVLTAAVREPGDPFPARPVTMARLDGGTPAVSGLKVAVPYAAAADWILVPARVSADAPAGGTAVVVVDPSGPGVSVEPTYTSAGGPEATVRLDEAPVRHVLGGADDQEDQAVPGLYQLAVAGSCCLADGALATALELTTEHVRSRCQFGRPLATFQAVAQQVADVYVTARTLHLIALSACWRLATGRPAGRDLDVAGYWLGAEAPAALRTCHHLHGGLGMDVSYPLHRYSALVRDLVRGIGGTGYRLDQLAARPAGYE